MTAPARISRRLGFLGALLVHGGIAAFLLVGVSQALPTPLPPPVEAVVITLSDPSPGPQSAPAPAAPEEPPSPPREETPPPPPEPTPAVEKVVEKPVERPRKQTPPKPRRAEPAAPSAARTSPSSTSAGTGTPHASAATAEARQTLLSALIARIEREKRYPPAARRLGLEGVVQVEVRVDVQGRIISVRTREGQAHTVLEKATRETLQRVQEDWKPMPMPEATTLNIPIRYSLKNS